MLNSLLHVEDITATNHLIDLQNRVQPLAPHFHRDIGEEIHDMVRFTSEPFARFRILCRHANRTSVEVTLPHHDAAFGDQCGGRKTKFIRAKQCPICGPYKPPST